MCDRKSPGFQTQKTEAAQIVSDAQHHRLLTNAGLFLRLQSAHPPSFFLRIFSQNFSCFELCLSAVSLSSCPIRRLPFGRPASVPRREKPQGVWAKST